MSKSGKKRVTRLKLLRQALLEGRLDEWLDRYRGLLDSIDGAVEQSLETRELAEPCRPGDCVCCRGIFEVSLLDLLLLARALSKTPSKTNGPKARDLQRRLARNGLVFPPESGRQASTEPDFSAFDEEDCVLLDSAGLCSLYADRPSVCRFQGYRFADPDSGLSLGDDCPNASQARSLAFPLKNFFQIEAEITRNFTALFPEFDGEEIFFWDSPILSAIVLAEDLTAK